MKHEIPEFTKLTKDFGRRMEEHLGSLDDFAAAIDDGGSPDEIVDNWQARTLLRTMPDEAQEN